MSTLTAKKFFDALGDIDSRYIEEAIKYKAKTQLHFSKWGITAACLFLTMSVMLSITVLQQYRETTVDTEQMSKLTMTEALDNPTFGNYFPQEVLDGYILEGSIGIYNGTVLKAKFYNSALSDEMTITIASKNWFSEQDRNLKLNTVMYMERSEATASYINIDADNYIVQYMFSTRDIAEIEKFKDMVMSAAQISEYLCH